MYTLNTTEVHAVCYVKSRNATSKDDLVVGFDSYNLTLTGEIAKTMMSEKCDNEHIPVVIMAERTDEADTISD